MRARQRYDYDLVIVGGGSAGIVAGNVAGALGARVALVEKRRIGGECLWTGCVPSKALLHVADVAHTMRRAKDLGLKNARLTRDDCAGALLYVKSKIDEVRESDATEQMLRDFGVEIVFGEPRFVSPHVLSTPRGDLRAASFLLATGSSPRVPEIPGLRETGFITNTSLFDLDHIPASLVVLGGGYIGCEMGQAFRRLGANVTIVDRGERLLKRDDAELADLLTAVLRGEGIEIVLGAEIAAVRKGEDGGKVVSLQGKGEQRELVGEEILAAAGRRPNSEDLGLDAAGVERDGRGSVRTDETGRTGAPHIWACGDVAGKYPFSHMAEHEAKILVRNILFPGRQAVPLDIAPWAIFTDPEMAHVGLTEEEARRTHGARNVQVLRHEFRQDDRAIVEDRTTGRVKVIVTGLSGKVVGAHLLGPGAGDLIQEWVIAMRHNLPARAIADLIHVYPTVSVSNQRAAQRWYAALMGKPIVKGTLSTLFGLEPRDATTL